MNKSLLLQRKVSEVWEFAVALRVAAPAILRLPPERRGLAPECR
jgi:hypothetical protein